MAGFRVNVNGDQLASVSNEELNILAVQIYGDVVGKELATIDVYGGNYGNNEEDTHLIWVKDHEIKSGDEVEIIFHENTATSHLGKPIKEFYPSSELKIEPQQPMDELFNDLWELPRLRDNIAIELDVPNSSTIHSSTGIDEYGFSFIAMWKWTKPDEARISLTSNSLEGIEKREGGKKHAGLSLLFEQGVNFRVRT